MKFGLLKNAGLLLTGSVLGVSLMSYTPQTESIMNKIDALTQKGVEYKTEVKDLTFDNNELTTQLNNANEELKVLVAEKTELEKQLEDAITSGNLSKEEISKLENEIVELNKLITLKDGAMQDLYDNWGREVTSLKTKIAELETELEENNNNHASAIEKANQMIEQANQDQENINNKLDSALEELHN